MGLIMELTERLTDSSERNTISVNNITAIILCGGKSSRMKTNKALLKLNDKIFLDIIINEMSFASDIILSIGSSEEYDDYNYKKVSDLVAHKGPLVGLLSAMQVCTTEYAFVVPCDLPFISKEFVLKIIDSFDKEYDAIVPVTIDKKVHPLCGLYKVCLKDKIKDCIDNGDLRVMDFINGIRTQYLKVNNLHELININTPFEYEKIRNEE